MKNQDPADFAGNNRQENNTAAYYVLDDGQSYEDSPYRDTPLPARDTPLPLRDRSMPARKDEIPEQIRKMRRLYEYSDGSFRQKCKNFYLQGMYMKDYEDDAPWNGRFRHYFPVYQDLGVDQLRGYFTWRTAVRRGTYPEGNTCYAYLYLYELLNGIGSEGPEDTLSKMKAFENGYLDAGYGDPAMRKNLHRWLLEYAVVKNLPAEEAASFADPAVKAWDHAMVVLQAPDGWSDEELFEAIESLPGNRIGSSVTVVKEGAAAKRLFARLWRHVVSSCRDKGRDFFTECFGKKRIYLWHPLGNAVYWEHHRQEKADYVLNESRRFYRREGVWYEESYQSLYFNKRKFNALFHEADRQFRDYLKTGHSLKAKPEEAWAASFVEKIIAEDRKEKTEAARPKIVIDFSGLEKIRQDAEITRDSLLTEEERAEEAKAAQADEPQKEPPRQILPDGAKEAEEGQQFGKDSLHGRILEYLSDENLVRLVYMLLTGKDTAAFLSAGRLMPTVAADAVNEALFDLVGDNVLECEDDRLSLVEDYREDLMELFEE